MTFQKESSIVLGLTRYLKPIPVQSASPAALDWSIVVRLGYQEVFVRLDRHWPLSSFNGLSHLMYYTSYLKLDLSPTGDALIQSNDQRPQYLHQCPFSNTIPCSLANFCEPRQLSIALSTPPTHRTNHAKLEGSPLIIHLPLPMEREESTCIRHTKEHRFLHLVSFQ